MSISLELLGGGRKTGSVCDRSYRAADNCPLIIRQTSEDLITANVFGLLKHFRPELWLQPMMAAGFHQPPASPFDPPPEVRLWQPVEPPPSRCGSEGRTEVDAHITFGSSVLYIEAKYAAPLSSATTSDPNRDQLARLLEVAYFANLEGRMFRREPFVLVLGAQKSEPHLVRRYRSAAQLRDAVPLSRTDARDQFSEYMSARVGYLSWSALAELLVKTPGRSPLEASLLDELALYLRRKTRQLL